MVKVDLQKIIEEYEQSFGTPPPEDFGNGSDFLVLLMDAIDKGEPLEDLLANVDPDTFDL